VFNIFCSLQGIEVHLDIVWFHSQPLGCSLLVGFGQSSRFI